MYAGTANDKIKAHLKKLTPGKLQKDTKYAPVTPIKNVNIKTPNKRTKELKIYSYKKVFFKIIEQFPVVSKKLLKTVNIGIATIRDIKKELKYQILIFFKNIYIVPITHLTG